MKALKKHHSHQSIKIFMIEDDHQIAAMYTEQFQLEGMETIHTEFPEKAISLLQKTQPHIILLDIILPRIDGLQLLRIIKNEEGIKDIPVFILSNLSQTEDMQRAFRLGAADYLIKTQFFPSQVVHKIKHFFRKNLQKPHEMISMP